jgi:16S rRNA (cytosine1407-C5)-methyltransferase
MARRKSKEQKQLTSEEILEQQMARFQPLLDGKEWKRLLAELELPLYQGVRANPLKVDPQPAIQSLVARYDWTVEQVPFCPHGWWVSSSSEPISHPVEHRLGEYYIQDAASMLPVELFDLGGLDAPLILDMAASPGGKTTHIVSRTGDHGLVVANDSSRDRLTALRLVMQSWGAMNLGLAHFPGERYGAWFPEVFDRVLLDAPCSMQGLRATDAHSLRAISDNELLALSRRQVRLLTSALQAVKVGGQVVYATCTLSPEEDEAVLDAVLRRFGGAVQIVDLSGRFSGAGYALAAYGSQTFDPAVQGAARLWPHRFGTAGFFTALLTKTASISGREESAPARPWERTGLRWLTRPGEDDLIGRLQDRYGIDLEPVLSRQGLTLWQRNERIFALPEAWLDQFETFPFHSLGMLVGEETPSGFAPSFEWVARFGRQARTGKVMLPSACLDAWLRGEDIPGSFGSQDERGKVAVVVDEKGRLLGHARLLSDRLKNLLPARLAY